VNSVKDLIALARARPGQLTFASGGIGTPAHVAGELFKSLARVDIVHVPYKGGGLAANALLSGEVSLSFGSVLTVVPHVKNGRLKAIAVSAGKRSPAMPDLPTIAEAGVPGFDLNSWYGVLAPASTPRDIIAKLNAEIVRILRLPEVHQRLLAEGLEPAGTSPEQFGAYIKSEIQKWAGVIRRSGAKAE
jgi:tripartite-type tricarboxylate transporter receptor subunit TctC